MSTDNSLKDILQSLRTQSSSSCPAEKFEDLSDETLFRSYETMRREVEADRHLDLRYRLVGDAAKMRAELLRAEMARRGIRFVPIVWP